MRGPAPEAEGVPRRLHRSLRRKKYQESLLAKTDAQLEQLEVLTARVEFALIQKDIVFGLEQGTRVLGEIHAEMGGIEHVEKLMGENAEAVAYQKVGFTLSRSSCLVYSAQVSLDVERRLLTRVGGERHARQPHVRAGRR